MGFTPLEGLVMATRSGPRRSGSAAVAAEHAGLTADEVDDALDRRSGLLGLAGSADMRDVIAGVDRGEPDARLAFDVYVHRLRELDRRDGGVARRPRRARLHWRRRRARAAVRRRSGRASRVPGRRSRRRPQRRGGRRTSAPPARSRARSSSRPARTSRSRAACGPCSARRGSRARAASARGSRPIRRATPRRRARQRHRARGAPSGSRRNCASLLGEQQRERIGRRSRRPPGMATGGAGAVAPAASEPRRTGRAVAEVGREVASRRPCRGHHSARPEDARLTRSRRDGRLSGRPSAVRRAGRAAPHL